MRTKIAALLFVSFVLAAFLVPTAPTDAHGIHCNWYWDSHEERIPGYGDVCVGSGEGCLDCWCDLQGEPHNCVP